jgi:hypothetical protein
MRRIFLTLAIIALATSTLTSCREEKTEEVERLAPDADDSEGFGYDTNSTENDRE